MQGTDTLSFLVAKNTIQNCSTSGANTYDQIPVTPFYMWTTRTILEHKLAMTEERRFDFSFLSGSPILYWQVKNRNEVPSTTNWCERIWILCKILKMNKMVGVWLKADILEHGAFLMYIYDTVIAPFKQ